MDFEPKKILKQYWNFDSFRDVQEDIVNSVLSGKDTLALLPTGGGKSVCFQVPALVKEGVCIVVTPLVALMKDQVDNLKRRGIKALLIHSGMTKRQIDFALDNAIYGNYKFLYVSPERLKTTLFKERLKKMTVNLIAVDEAHCISQWGYDFRPAYLEIANLRSALPGVPVLALTATATPRVVEDIQERLGFETKNVKRKSFFRENLRYFVTNDERKLDTLLAIIRKQRGTGIVYVRSRKHTVEYANLLKSNNVTADFYHAGLSHEEREKKQKRWMDGAFQVICCTNAFGMGIDKPDVRFVVNMDLPESIEAYFQEAGRGGRDGKKSFAVLVVDEGDRATLLKRTEQRFPDFDTIKRVYGFVCNELRIAIGAGQLETYGLDWQKLEAKGAFSFKELLQSAKFLERAGYWQLSEGAKSNSELMIIVNQQSLYDVQLRYPLVNKVVQVILRSYSGLFDSYTTIREKEIAKRSGVSQKEVVQVLNQLHQLELIDYKANLNEESLTFLLPRADLKHLRIPIDFYEGLKQVAFGNTEAMINYAYATNQCRSKMLLAYFGEEQTDNCGVCDYCLKLESSADLSSKALNALKTEVVDFLKDSKDVSVGDIVNNYKTKVKKDQVKYTVQWMLDNGIVLVDDQQNLKLK